MPWSTILVRYGELGIKSPAVRARWEKRLVENVETALARRGAEGEVVRERGRILLRANAPEKAIDALAHTFGVVSASVAEEIPADADKIASHVADASRALLRPGQTFAVRARRIGEHGFTSMQLAKDVGAAVWRANREKQAEVDLTDPDVELAIEVRDSKAYFYRETTRGPGGLPLGTQGRVVVLLDSPRAALAAWLFMKRGTTPLFLAPADAVPREAARALLAWCARVPVTLLDVPPAWNASPARRRAFLARAAGAFARPRRGQAVVLADGLDGQAAFAALDGEANLPVFRPLAGYSGEKLTELARFAEIPGVVDESLDVEMAPAIEVPPEDVREAFRAGSSWEAERA